MVLIDSIASNSMVMGAERQLLVKMLMGLGLDVKQDVLLCALNTGPSCEALEEPARYRQSLEKAITGCSFQSVLSLGSLVPRYLLGNTQAFSHHVDQWSEISLKDRKYPILFCWHPGDYIREPALKKNSWQQMVRIRN